MEYIITEAHNFVFIEFALLMTMIVVLLIAAIRWHVKLERLSLSANRDMTTLNGLITRLDGYFAEVSKDNERCEILRKEISSLSSFISELRCQRDDLQFQIAELTEQHSQLEEAKYNEEYRLEQLKRKTHEFEEHLPILQKQKEGIEAYLKSSSLREIKYLSNPIYYFGFTRAIQSKLEGHGFGYIGEVAESSEERLLEIDGVGAGSVARIKRLLKEHDADFGMDIVRIDNRWYRKPLETV